jgi:hypothetical protein
LNIFLLVLFHNAAGAGDTEKEKPVDWQIAYFSIGEFVINVEKANPFLIRNRKEDTII